MKTKLTLSIAIIFTVFISILFMLPVQAGIVEHGDYKPISMKSSFNAMRGLYSSEEEAYDHICYYVGNHVGDGVVSYEMPGKVLGVDHTIMEYQTYKDGLLIKIEDYFDDTLFYSIDIFEDLSCEIIKDEEINFPYLFHDASAKFERGDNVYILLDDEQIEDYNAFRDISSYSYYYLYGITYTFNEAYIDNDLHVVMGYKNKKTIDEIISDLEIIDVSTTGHEIIDNTYDYLEATVGSYTFTIVAYDTSKNVTLQRVIVDVVDLIKPTIVQKNTIRTRYNNILNKDEILACFDISDASDIDIQLDIENYLNNQNTIGEYECSITVKDHSEYQNEASLDFSIYVIDDVPPLLAYGRIINTDYHTYYTKEDILKLFTAIDEYDGNIRDSIQIEDLDDYENNYMNLGTYQFMVSVQDSSSNKVSVKFNIYVRDYTAPIIKLEQYVILTEKGKPIAKEQIIELFQTLGYSIDGSMMNSECFSLDALDGEYPLEIELETGDIEHDIISTERDMNISFDEPIKDENNINLALILSLSIGGFLLLSIGTMGIIIYKKRH
jgi:hypothetical protein